MRVTGRLVVALSLVVSVVLVSRCETLAPEAQAVKLTSTAEDVAGCKILGTVESVPPYVGPNDGVNQLKNKAAGMGGNVVFLTSSGGMRGRSGMAYLCPSASSPSR